MSAEVALAGPAPAWQISVKNVSPAPFTLVFPTSQQGDVVLVANGVEHYRWSRDRFFLQVVGERTLEPGETWTFALEGEPEVESGSYVAVATVACSPELPAARKHVVVP